MLNDVDEFKGRDEGYIDRINESVSKWDYLVSPSPYATECFKSAFRFNKEMLEVGYPRNDIFYQDEKLIEEQRERQLNENYLYQKIKSDIVCTNI